MRPIRPQSLRKDQRAVGPAVSTVIMIAAVTVMVLVAMSYANYILDVRLAENEFSSNKQFMYTTGLQIDDVSWTVGRTQTVGFSSRYGYVKYQPLALNYSVDMNFGSGFEPVISNLTTGMVMYNMPVTNYNLGNNYSERISPRYNWSFLQQGPTAQVSHVFIVEQVPMPDGSFIRIVAVPTLRALNSSIIGPSQDTSTTYWKFFLPTLQPSTAYSSLSKSVTMVGNNVVKIIKTNVTQVRINVNFPNAGTGFNSTFFGFENTVELSPILPADSLVEFYIGSVAVSVGQT